MFGLMLFVGALFWYEPVQGHTTLPQQREYPEGAYKELRFIFLYLACMSKKADFSEAVVECFEPQYIIGLDNGGGEYEALSNDTKARLHELRECLKEIHSANKIRQKNDERKCFRDHNFNELFVHALEEVFTKDEVRRFKEFLNCLNKYSYPMSDDNIQKCIKEDPIVYEMLEIFALMNMKHGNHPGHIV